MRSDFAIGIRYRGPDDEAGRWFRGALAEVRRRREGAIKIEIETRWGERESGSLVAVSESPKDLESHGTIELDEGRRVDCDGIAAFRLLPRTGLMSARGPARAGRED
jgi:hypothetical protein